MPDKRPACAVLATRTQKDLRTTHAALVACSGQVVPEFFKLLGHLAYEQPYPPYAKGAWNVSKRQKGLTKIRL